MASNLPAGQPSQPTPTQVGSNGRGRVRALQTAFCVLVFLLAVFQFSENNADPDLWGHVVFGQQMLKTGSLQKTEIYSWTAFSQPWINHECLAEISLGAAHLLLGGTGLLLLKVGIGLLTFALCARLGTAGLAWPGRFIAWAFGAVAVVEISYGFAARPQIFTALFLAVELFLLRRIHDGARRWAWALPVLFAVWINTHGGVLAGFGLLGLAAGASTLQFLRQRFAAKGNAAPTTVAAGGSEAGPDAGPGRRTIQVLWLAVVASGAALFCNPWRGELLRWLVGSVLWLRPEIEEWNPTPLGWDHAAFFALAALTLFAWACTRRRRALWETGACAAFALLGWRAVRNAPLFGVVALALVPAHLADALGRLRRHLGRWETLARAPGFQRLATGVLAVGCLGTLVGTFALHKEHPLTMEVPRSKYPVAAVAFLQEHDLRGRMLVFFDWGEMVIFQLPDCPPSIDGRLDTCYPRPLLAAHWKFYNAEPFDEQLLNPDQADLALLPANLAGAATLAHSPGWQAVYFDDTAVLLVRDAKRFSKLNQLTLPVQGPKSAALGRAAFPDRNPRWKTE